MPYVSLVVPCHNQSAFITETLESVLRQTFGDWECIVVDDGSTDDSHAIIEQFAQRDSRFIHLTKANGGVAAARNHGFERAQGTLFVPLDGDDKLHPDFLMRAVERFSAQPDTDLVHCQTKRFGATNKVWRLPEYSYEKLLWQNMIVNTSMFRRDAFQRAGGYAPEMKHGFEDWEFYVRLLSPQAKVQFIDAPLFFYRVKKQSRSIEQIDSGRIEESQRMIFARNPEAYAQYAANPIGVFGQRMKEFAPTYTARYKRQARYVHAVYGALIAALVGVAALVAR